MKTLSTSWSDNLPGGKTVLTEFTITLSDDKTASYNVGAGNNANTKTFEFTDKQVYKIGIAMHEKYITGMYFFKKDGTLVDQHCPSSVGWGRADT